MFRVIAKLPKANYFTTEEDKGINLNETCSPCLTSSIPLILFFLCFCLQYGTPALIAGLRGNSELSGNVLWTSILHQYQTIFHDRSGEALWQRYYRLKNNDRLPSDLEDVSVIHPGSPPNEPPEDKGSPSPELNSEDSTFQLHKTT